MRQNYAKINRYSLRHDYYCYADMPKYKADLIFVKKRIRVTFLKECKKDKKYILIMCRVKKKDSETFISCMEELKNKMILLGCTDYPEFCRNTISSVCQK